MFFDKNKFLGRVKFSKEPILEYSFGELKALSDPARRSRSKGIITRFMKLTQGPDGQARTLWDVPSQNTRGVTYRVTVGIDIPKIGLFGLVKQHKGNPAKLTHYFKEMDVKVHCTCADFYWAGPKYNLGSSGFLKGSLVPNQNAGHKGSGYSEQTVVTEPPDSRDPNREHVLCKHCLAVSTNFAANALQIMKEARNFAVKIKINDEMSKQEDSGKAVLKKDVDFVNMKKDESDKITEAIIHGVEEISKEDSTLQKDSKPEEISPEINEIPSTEETTPLVSEETPQIEEPELTEKPLDSQANSKTTYPMVDEDEIPENPGATPEPEVTPQPLEKNQSNPPEGEKIDSDLNPINSGTEVEDEKKKANPNDILGKPAPLKNKSTDEEQPPLS